MKYLFLLLLVSCISQPHKVELKDVIVDGELYQLPPGSKVIIKTITKEAPVPAPTTDLNNLKMMNPPRYVEEPDWDEIDNEINEEEKANELVLPSEPAQEEDDKLQYEGFVSLGETEIDAKGAR
jgi:hypothetical protein